ncbi:hypothetical protein IJM86_01955 [bacterium]|nr:hypothetical protein [bacterium]
MIQYVTTEVEYLKDLQKIYPFLQKQDLSDATEDELAEYSNLVDKIGQYESRMDTEFEAVEKAQKDFSEKYSFNLAEDPQQEVK